MIILGKRRLTLQDIDAVVHKDEQVELAPDSINRVAENHEFLKRFSANKLIYGLSTGFGPMARYRISTEDQIALQFNLIRSHSAGAGSLLPPLLARAVLVARLNSLLAGYSGIHPDTVLALANFINHQISPCIYEHGGVGASGDLVQLAHLALNLIGEGEVWYEGKVQPTKAVMDKLGLHPMNIHIREGLAIVNGTSAMTGIGVVNLILAKKLLNWSVVLSAMTNELTEAYDDHFSPGLNKVKHHAGQREVAAAMSTILRDSQLIRKRQEHLYNGQLVQDILDDKVQEYYSLRCVPQILGPILDTIANVEKVLLDELNSVSDNPVVDHEEENIFHGGNFHGDYVSMEMDKLKISITKLAMLSERQLNFLLNNNLNHKLPPFVNLGRLGFNLGMQGVQFTAVSTVAENQTLSYPMYLHSIPNNNDNQDIVSMGCNAALLAKKVVENTFEVLAIQLMAIAQAVDYLECEDRLSSVSMSIYREVREVFTMFVDDQPRYKDIESVKNYLHRADHGIFR
ncbi:MAG: aromatic amino acid ammonia-lyase [Saprospiraceae bacterium]